MWAHMNDAERAQVWSLHESATAREQIRPAPGPVPVSGREYPVSGASYPHPGRGVAGPINSGQFSSREVAHAMPSQGEEEDVVSSPPDVFTTYTSNTTV